MSVNAVVAYYPACAYTQKWDSEIPVLILAGEIDDIAPVRHCEGLLDTLPKRHRVTVRVYDTAHHCFDNVTLPAEMQCRFGTIGYNETATKAAWKEVTNFLRK